MSSLFFLWIASGPLALVYLFCWGRFHDEENENEWTRKDQRQFSYYSERARKFGNLT